MMLLDELLLAQDLGQAVRGFARPFWDRHGLPPIDQLGLVVPNVEQAAGALEAQGVAPFFIADGAPVLWRERGAERTVRGKMAVIRHRRLELELLEPLSGSDFYTQHLDPGGRIVVQHLGMRVDDVDGWARRLNAAGLATWVRGRLKLGPVTSDFCYMDTVDAAGFVVEFICWRLGGRQVTVPGGLLAAGGRLEKWSGHRSLAVKS